jgi:hypothetical protein
VGHESGFEERTAILAGTPAWTDALRVSTRQTERFTAESAETAERTPKRLLSAVSAISAVNARYARSLSAKCWRNFATFGATTAWQ